MLRAQRRQKTGTARPALKACDWISSELPAGVFHRTSHTGAGKGTPASPFSADQQKCPGSTLQHPPHPRDKETDTLWTWGPKEKDPNPHQDTASGTIFKNKKLETIGEWLSRRPRIRIESYTAIERVSTEVGNPSKCQIYKRWQNSTCRNCKICQMIYTQMNKNRKWVCGESNSSDSLRFFFPPFKDTQGSNTNNAVNN